MDKIDRFVSKAVIELINSNIGVEFINKSRIEYFTDSGVSYNCDGCFDSEKLTVAIDKDKKDWFITFIHEYCHYLQMVSNDPCFFNQDVYGVDEFENWINKETEIKDNLLKKAIKSIQLCEHNCDKKAVELIKAYKLPINTSDYIKQSNAYVFTYEFQRRYRTNLNTPFYEVFEVWSLFKDSWYSDYSKLPKNIENKMLEFI